MGATVMLLPCVGSAECSKRRLIRHGTFQRSVLPSGRPKKVIRSMAERLLKVSSGIEVPSEHVAQGRTARATRLANAENLQGRPPVHIQSTPSSPANTYAVVRYRDTWMATGRHHAEMLAVISPQQTDLGTAQAVCLPQDHFEHRPGIVPRPVDDVEYFRQHRVALPPQLRDNALSIFYRIVLRRGHVFPPVGHGHRGSDTS